MLERNPADLKVMLTLTGWGCEVVFVRSVNVAVRHVVAAWRAREHVVIAIHPGTWGPLILTPNDPEKTSGLDRWVPVAVPWDLQITPEIAQLYLLRLGDGGSADLPAWRTRAAYLARRAVKDGVVPWTI